MMGGLQIPTPLCNYVNPSTFAYPILHILTKLSFYCLNTLVLNESAKYSWTTPQERRENKP
jgi:hypothetical protein